jgi:hypothetical protein
VTTVLPPGFATAGGTLPLEGTGEPGAVISVSPTATAAKATSLSALSGSVSSVGSTTVTAQGTWSLVADIAALHDGEWTLSVTQTTAGGASSPAVVRLSIDRTALAPVISSVDTGTGVTAGLLSPVVAGTAEPGATVELFDHGVQLATVVADENGMWTSPELITARADYSVSARQADRLGNVSPQSSPASGLVGVPTVTASGAPGTVSLFVQNGLVGAQAQVWADGTPTQFMLTLDSAGAASAIYTWTPGDHRIGVVYLFGDRHGVLTDTPVTLP